MSPAWKQRKARKASEVVKVPGWEAKGFPLSFAIKVRVDDGNRWDAPWMLVKSKDRQRLMMASDG